MPRHALPACRPQPARGGRGSRAFSGGFLLPPADTRHAPLEILAPAGDEESLGAALAAGADAIYFGLSDGFNARARAGNFELAGLPAVMERIHRRGARGYLTLNTLVFDSELERMEEILRAVSRAGVDAILVQDPAVALLAREACPGLDVHASTQMTVSSPEGVSLARDLGITRIVAPRELSLGELTRLLADSPLEVEVFIHGALCVSWSGQCLTSEAWGGRSANRGQCAQSCRLPYDLVVDDETRELGEMAYLLSPRDLAGWRHVPELMRLGVSSIKIEGRQKGPAYVATAVQAYRRVRERVRGGAPELLTPPEVDAMAVTFSRGFSEGFFAGSDHQTLVDGRFPKHRGLPVGRVSAVIPGGVLVRPGPSAPPLRPGDGVVFDDGHPERAEPGGPVFEVGQGPAGEIRLAFGQPGPDLGRVRPGQRVWKTADVEVARQVRQLLKTGEEERRLSLALRVTGEAGAPLAVVARSGGAEARVASGSALAPATGAGLDAALLHAKLGRLGETAYRLDELDATGLRPGLHLPVSELNALRRSVVEQLDAARAALARRAPASSPALPRLLERYPAGAPPTDAPPVDDTPRLIPLCRTDEQLDALLELGCPELELDWMELVGLERAVGRVRTAGRHLRIATMRIQKPGEEGYDGRLARLEPDSLLVRHWGALEYFRAAREAGRSAARPPARPIPLHGDFSLNVANGLTARFLLERGLSTLTPAHDLDATQVFHLLRRVEPGRVTITLHHHIATFHTEHCVYAHLLSEGRDYRDCGRPCEAHRVSLRDRTGDEHPVVVDVGCRNTVFNARAQTAAAHVPGLLAAGVRRFRVEFVREGAEDVRRVMVAYRELLAGRATPREAVQAVGALEKFGVTSGTLKVLAGAD